MADELITPAPGGTPTPAEPAKTVAYENFQAVVAAKTGLEGQVAQLKGQIQTLTEKAATVDALTGQITEWRTKAEKAEGKFQTYTEFSSALGSTSPKIIGIFDQEYASLPETDRPTRKAWVEALKADPTAAPEHLAPWLAPAASQAATGTTIPKPPAPKVPGTPPTPPGAPSSVSAEEVRRVREEAVRTGNWTPWKELTKSMGLRK